MEEAGIRFGVRLRTGWSDVWSWYVYKLWFIHFVKILTNVHTCRTGETLEKWTDPCWGHIYLLFNFKLHFFYDFLPLICVHERNYGIVLRYTVGVWWLNYLFSYYYPYLYHTAVRPSSSRSYSAMGYHRSHARSQGRADTRRRTDPASHSYTWKPREQHCNRWQNKPAAPCQCLTVKWCLQTLNLSRVP